ncbi:Hypothetical predicted protein [Lecanosticta acicola]|uniref:Ankyrin repeat protein n=1 Tax=Lecanosticta acicola TaxID=111012 RepID=A0AAI8YXM3_9PEZI|nr:Hypothetical predicted protein [Lecanosticta acicola]
MAQVPTIDRLLNLAADSPSAVQSQLEAHPHLASQKDAHGYSLVHAAASYGHEDLLRALINDYNVDPNITDEDGETALFSVEEVRMAQLLLALGTDLHRKNDEGQTAAEKLDDADEQPAIAAFLRETAAGGVQSAASSSGASAQQNGGGQVHPPPPLPNGLQLNVGTMPAGDAGEEPDPEFRRRIEELASRPDFQTEEGQRELRELVMDAVSGIANEGEAPAATRRRLG